MLSPLEQSIKRKIESQGVPLKSWNINIYRGILTGCNEAFIISGEKKDELIAEDPKSAEIIRPILRGKDIKRYSYNYADLWLIATFPSKHYDINNFPAVKKYLLSFGIEKLEQTGNTHIIDGEEVKSRKKTNNKWFETQDSISYWDDFSKQKIVWGNLCLSSQFAYAPEGYYINAPATMIVPGDKYILALLNSKLGDWYIRQLGVTRNGGYFEYKPMFVEKLPIPMIRKKEKEPFIDCVNKLIDNNENRTEDLEEVEKTLNSLVYKLYNISDTEKEYIEKY